MANFVQSLDTADSSIEVSEGLAVDVNFLSSERVHLDIKDDFKRTYPSGHKGISQTEKVASGIIDVYERAKGQKLLDKPIDIRVNIMVTSIP